jgi:serine/threonine protein kinase/Tol biopolymer transport system component
MTPERWQQVKAIFNSAIRYLPEQRDSFLSEACSGDTRLRSEVESLIASHERSGEFIDEPAYQDAAWLADEKAELKAGQAIGSYQVLSFISRGGMGEVYLAQDQRLSRKVALKLLPVSFTTDIDRLRRFEQEARAASALNHPNIITIYEIQEFEGSHVIATEFVEGETLRQRLSRARLSLSETLNIAIQIADALSAAHKAGIVHRDIKPENVMLRPDGYVKVLDFGLAKLSEQASPLVSSEAPTIQVRTGSGIVIGTAGYMSPEQARGLAVDGRSDIFSLGAMMYEMITLQKPFHGETPSDTLASILKTEPPSVSQIKPGIPPELNRIVSKTLRKDREERYQVVKDLWLDLKSLKQELEFQEKLERSTMPDSTDSGATSPLPVAQTTEPRSAITTISESLSIEIKRHKFGAAVALLALVLIIAGATFGIYRYVNRPRPVERFWDVRISRITNSGNAIDATISPDGKYVVYALSTRGAQSLYIRQVNAANDKLIVPPAPVGFFGLTFSPDGTELFYAVKASLDAGTLYRIPVLGGTPVKVLERIDGPISFSPDGKRFVLIRGNSPNQGDSALVIANIDGSEQRDLAVRKLPEKFSPSFFTGPSWSPDGKLVAATVATIGGWSRLMSFSVDDGSERELSSYRWQFAARTQWLSDMSGLLLVGGDSPRESQIWYVGYPDGKARRVTNDLNPYRAIGLTADSRKFTTVQAQGLVNLYVVPGGDASKAVRLGTGNVGFYGTGGNSVAWTPDGHIAVTSTEDSGVPDIWFMDQNGENRKQLTANGAQNTAPVVSPDGKYIVYSSLRDGVKTTWRMNVDGSNQVKLTNGPADALPTISPDGKWVIFTSAAGSQPQIFKVSIEGGTPQLITDKRAAGGRVSPDGKLIMFTYADSPDPYAPPNRIGVIPFEGSGEEKNFEIPSQGTVPTLAEWSLDGKSVIYTVNANNVSNLWSQSLSGGPAKQITDFKDGLITGFAYSNDGKILACSRGTLLRDAVLITDVKTDMK